MALSETQMDIKCSGKGDYFCFGVVSGSQGGDAGIAVAHPGVVVGQCALAGRNTITHVIKLLIK